MLAAMLSDTPSPSCKRQRTCSSSPRAAEVDQQHQQQQQYLSGITACEDIEVSASVPTSLDSSSAAENTVAIEDARVEEFIEISSQEDVVCEDSGCYASRDGLPETSALVSTLLSVALKQWRGAMPEVPPPFYIFSMKGSEIVIPRGIALYPHLVDGSFVSSHQIVERNVRAILARRERPLFYIGSTMDLIYRWRDLRDQDGRLAGHAFAKNIRWHTMLALYRTDNGNCCALMEEALINTFSRKAFSDGCCQNASMKALRVQKSSLAEHWVYICLPKC